MTKTTLDDVFNYWFIDPKHECWRDRRTNQIVCYFNKEKQKELLEKVSNAPTIE